MKTPQGVCLKERGHSCPMPLGFDARSDARQRRLGLQRRSGSPVPPHPNPLPWGLSITHNFLSFIHTFVFCKQLPLS